MPAGGASRRSSALGAMDPRARRDAQARTVDGLQVKDPLFFDTDQKLTLDPSALVPPPGIARRAVAASYTMVPSDQLIAVTSTAAARTITLEDAAAMAGRIVVIKDESGGAATNNITIDGKGAQTIDGAATLVMSTNYQAVQLYSTGTAWFTL